MGTLVYTPAIQCVVDSFREGVIDVSQDAVRGTISLSENSPHHVSITLTNAGKKYDGVFLPNDRISIRLKRITWLQSFSGYLNSVPVFSLRNRSVTLDATCTLKRVQFCPWDPGSAAAYSLLNDFTVDELTGQVNDGGMALRMIRLLRDVGRWPEDQIHIGAVPAEWMETTRDLYGRLASRIAADMTHVGSGSSIGGGKISTSAALTGVLTLTDAGTGTELMTGQIPEARGKGSAFGGIGTSDATGSMALSGEPGNNPRDIWYCAMRWPYIDPESYFKRAGVINIPGTTGPNRTKAKLWWKDKRILVTNPANNKQVVLRAADWGPNMSTGVGKADDHPYDIDMSPEALHVHLGAAQGDWLDISFAPDQTVQPGVVIVTKGARVAGDQSGFKVESQIIIDPTGQGHGRAKAAGYKLPRKITDPKTDRVSGSAFEWGGYSNGEIPSTALETIESAGLHVSMHPLAAACMVQMINRAQQDGIKLTPAYGYRTLDRQKEIASNPLAAKAGTSVHGWGFAVDMHVNGRVMAFGDPEYGWMQTNANQFGWRNPLWAHDHEGKEEAWHWEFWGALGLDSLPDNLDVPLDAYAPSSGVGSGRTSGLGSSLFNTNEWSASPDPTSAILGGIRALMNDSPMGQMVATLNKASMRSYCSAPNGDFISWFPDYFNDYGIAGILTLQELELQDCTIYWGDERLITHQFVAGSTSGYSGGNLQPGGNDAASAARMQATDGIATVEFPELLRSMVGIYSAKDDPLGFSDPQAILDRFGARNNFTPMQVISDPRAEFWVAVYLLRQNWASQFTTSLPMTFMPEAFPGMILQVPSVGLQVYCSGVQHSFSFDDGGPGFTTTCLEQAPSAMAGGGLRGLLVKGGNG